MEPRGPDPFSGIHVLLSKITDAINFAANDLQLYFFGMLPINLTTSFQYNRKLFFSGYCDLFSIVKTNTYEKDKYEWEI